MSAPTPFTREQALAINTACKDIIARLSGPVEPYRAAEVRQSIIELRDIQYLAFNVIDDIDGHEGFETAHDALQTALELRDSHELWKALAAKVAA